MKSRRSLLRRGIPVRALSRSPSKASAQALARNGAEVVAGDLDDITSLTRFRSSRSRARSSSRARRFARYFRCSNR
ncbi:MAG TPA: NmrA family NAD(P)-binding protein [Myxococcales bacterium]|nr:NmrA family NAD(P)-binding protein [Myxococcales bacterium]